MDMQGGGRGRLGRGRHREAEGGKGGKGSRERRGERGSEYEPGTCTSCSLCMCNPRVENRDAAVCVQSQKMI